MASSSVRSSEPWGVVSGQGGSWRVLALPACHFADWSDGPHARSDLDSPWSLASRSIRRLRAWWQSAMNSWRVVVLPRNGCYARSPSLFRQTNDWGTGPYHEKLYRMGATCRVLVGAFGHKVFKQVRPLVREWWTAILDNALHGIARSQLEVRRLSFGKFVAQNAETPYVNLSDRRHLVAAHSLPTMSGSVCLPRCHNPAAR